MARGRPQNDEVFLFFFSKFCRKIVIQIDSQIIEKTKRKTFKVSRAYNSPARHHSEPTLSYLYLSGMPPGNSRIKTTVVLLVPFSVEKQFWYLLECSASKDQE